MENIEKIVSIEDIGEKIRVRIENVNKIDLSYMLSQLMEAALHHIPEFILDFAVKHAKESYKNNKED